ncbi:Phosphotransferase enzyme family protein [Streptomyces sp. YIM 121038]|uniref:phosphotransferase n=1 Tax=Streptomyces sp. YIM 121038 TaxID=2136401 RepID=UPI001110A746|nr:phosphotransferase [Streptomyces sp. YIM 121038]QCX77488.1 Phosphotransferase enzyme family protein [Streptomyces sp. YIM 121038]
MPSASTSAARARAALASGGMAALEGPLRGYHHETYVFPLPDESGVTWRWKCREPRPGLLWFDRRCFWSEEELLVALAGRVTRVPEVIQKDGFRLQRFIEGRTLGSCARSEAESGAEYEPGPGTGRGADIPAGVIDQIVALFGELAGVGPDDVAAGRRCAAADRPRDGDTNGFVERLVFFAEEYVYLKNEDRFGPLFKEFGIGRDSFAVLRERVSGLTRRPFCLLHGDLHGENFVLDRCGQLWTIDWELAMVGDPLYDLATHLHLMRYAPHQERQVVRRWCEAVSAARAGSRSGWWRDLPRLLDFKRAQSVFTDVIRAALMLEAEERAEGALERAAGRAHSALGAARHALDLKSVPSYADTMDALARWSWAEEERGPR